LSYNTRQCRRATKKANAHQRWPPMSVETCCYLRQTFCRSHVDQFVPRQPHSVRPLSWIQVDSTTGVVWSPTGVGLGADALSSIYSRSGTAGGILWTVSTLIRWRHPDLPVLSTRGHRQSTETCCWLCRCRRWLDAFQSTSAQCIQSKTEVLWCASARRQSQLPSDPLAVGSDLVSPVRCVRNLSIFIDADLTMRTQVTQTCSKCFAALRQLRSIRRSVSNDVMQSLIVALVFFQAWLRLRNACRPSEATHRQASVCAERRCTVDLQSLSSGPHSAVIAHITLASDARTYFVPAGSAGVSLPPRLCTWLPSLRSSERVTPQRTSTTALFDYISAGRSTHCAFYHWRPHLSSDCCITLEQFARVSPVIAVVASFSQ